MAFLEPRLVLPTSSDTSLLKVARNRKPILPEKQRVAGQSLEWDKDLA